VFTNNGISMNRQDASVFLHPGDYHFGRSGTRINTLLGSCVAVTVWHPQRRIGGMCHFLLPGRVRTPLMSVDGKYGDEAFSLLVNEMRAVGTAPTDYEAKLFGGGKMFPGMARNDEASIGRMNALAAKRLVNHYGMRISEVSLEGTGHRNVRFDSASGQVKVKHTRLSIKPRQCSRCENKSLCYEGAACDRSSFSFPHN
jgi:chemotaxis protein CheD